MSSVPTTHKAQLQDYFDGVGFDRWAAIYGNDPNLSRIRRTVQIGHARMLETAQSWLMQAHSGGSLLDAGCGTGLFSVTMAERGFDVTAVDLAPRMVAETRAAAQAAGVAGRLHAQVGDVGSVTGAYDAVACFDVLVHYPAAAFTDLCAALADRSQQTLILTYAPYNCLLATLHRVGGWFPKGQRRTEIQMIPDALVDETLAAAGMTVTRRSRIGHGFYHVMLLEAQRHH